MAIMIGAGHPTIGADRRHKYRPGRAIRLVHDVDILPRASGAKSVRVRRPRRFDRRRSTGSRRSSALENHDAGSMARADAPRRRSEHGAGFHRRPGQLPLWQQAHHRNDTDLPEPDSPTRQTSTRPHGEGDPDRELAVGALGQVRDLTGRGFRADVAAPSPAFLQPRVEGVAQSSPRMLTAKTVTARKMPGNRILCGRSGIAPALGHDIAPGGNFRRNADAEET